MKPYLVPLLILSTSTALACDADIDLGDVPGDTDATSGNPTSAGETGQTGLTAGSSTTTPEGATDSGETTSSPAEGDVEGIDVLFIVDNTISMGPAQRRLQESTSAIVSALDATGLDYRIGTTTTDNGNYWCPGSNSGPTAGRLIGTQSCRSRRDDFYFSGGEIDAFDEACAEHCTLDKIDLVDGSIPWLSADNLAGASMADALACSLPVGISGCAFEEPLEAMHGAMAQSEAPGNPETGFIRPNAHLVVIFVTDEVDCSLNPEHEVTVVGEDGVGNQVFWPFPDVNTPTSAVCWNAGVECSGSGTPEYDACMAQNKAIDGSNAASDDDSVMRPLSRYADRLNEIRASKVAGAGVYTFSITGVPESYISPADITYAAGANPTDPDSFEGRFGVSPGCAQGGMEAVPPVRMVEFTQGGDQTGVPLFSICSESYATFFEQIFGEVAG